MKKFLITLILLGVVFAFAACSGEEPRTPGAGTGGLPVITAGVISTPAIEAAPLISPGDSPNEPESQAVAAGANRFAFQLAAALMADPDLDADTENFVVSPYSVWLPLAALLNATDGYFLPAFIEILAAEGLGVDDINRAASRMLFNLTAPHIRYTERFERYFVDPLHIANAVFVDYSKTLNTEFAQAFADYFLGTAMNVDFSSPLAVDAVNQWAYDNTQGHISQVIEEFHPDTVAAIANAIFFTDKWADPFSPRNTRRDVFHAPVGDMYAHFMSQHFSFISHFEDGAMQSLTMRFTGGGGMTILLPHDGDAAGLLSGMTAEKFAEIERASVPANGRLCIPRFSFENTLELIPALSALGLDALFCELTVPLTHLIYSPFNCFIAQAVQVAMVEIDEEGATAAAVTVMDIADEGAPFTERTFEMVCDRPFAFILHRRTQDGGRQILFTGVVNAPCEYTS